MLFNYFPLGFSPFVAHELRVFSEWDSLWEPSNGDPTPGWFETSRSLPSRRHKGTCRISHPVLKNDLRRACFFFWHGSLHGAGTIKLHWSRLVKKKKKPALLLLSLQIHVTFAQNLFILQLLVGLQKSNQVFCVTVCRLSECSGSDRLVVNPSRASVPHGSRSARGEGYIEAGV